MSSEERRAYELLDSSCRKENNRYIIGVPWKRDITELPNNYNMAEKRLVSLERSLLKNPEKAELYSSAMEQYEVNGWSESVQEDAEGPIYYLPHHGVYRPEKKSTPLRVVFDPASTWQGMSLNSYMHKGPSLLGSLFSTLLRFRERPVAFVGDISKMYLQIRLMDRDTQVHRYLWRNLDVSREPVVYRMLRVTFGDKASPDMANFVMLRLADEFQMKYPEASRILRDDRYMDDILTSCDSQGEATDMMKNLDSILALGSVRIKEWICSTSETSAVDVPDASQGDVKTLGMFWNCHADSFCFKVERIAMEEYTRRTILSQIAKLYDPLGLATVVTIRSRIAMQELWRLKDYDWDDHLPKEVCEQWRDIFEDLEMLNKVQFERSLKPEDGHGTPELHVFADASVKAYGSCAYILWQTSSKPSVRLVSAKARVAPLRQSTIPRLELMAALMSSRLARTIHDNLRIKPEVYLWSDSQIVLHWLKSESRTKRPFVGVRVAEIQSEWERERWSYIASKENPADDLSRGIRADQIKDRWFHGPEFLRMPKSEWPEQIVIKRPEIDTEEKRETCCASVRVERGQPFIDCESFSDWKRLIRVTAYCLRFVNNLRYRHVEVLQRKDDCLQPEEMKEAENYWLKCAQDSMKDWKESCAELSSFMKEGIVRVGGRLGRSTLTYDEAHPVLLPASSYISKLVLRHAHDSTWHAGTERTLSESRRKYWVVRGRNAVKGLIKDCVLCRRQRSPPHTTYMADLPPERLKVFSPPYTTTGIDLFGPFLLRYGRNKSVNAWGALFTCATMRAIHLEIVESLSTDSFLHALRRFVAHHGWPATIITDNGTSFVGARGEIRRLLVDDRKRIQDFAVTHQVRWIFTTPVSPHQGGIYESLIKQTKRAIHVAIGQQTLTWNEMSTVFAEVECLINSRPLGFCSNDPNDLRPLTPNHFMLGRASAEIPQGPFEEMSNLTRRFQFVQTLMSHFWTVFQRQYLPTLMRRSKWRNMGRQIREGDVVLVVDYNLPRGRWCLGRVTETFPGIDGVVRNVGLKTQYGQYKRSVQKCIVLLEKN